MALKAPKLKISLILSLFFAIVLIPQTSISGVITKVRGKKVLIDMKNSYYPKGQIVKAVYKKKTRAIIQIQKIKGKKALGVIKKGKVRRGYRIISSRKYKRPVKNQALSVRSDTKYSKKGKYYLGALTGINIGTIAARLTSGSTTEDLSKSGMGFNLKGTLDYFFTEDVAIRALLGLESMSTSGTASSLQCESSSECVTNISYLTGDLLLKVHLIGDNTTFWGGGGIGLAMPLSKESNTISQESIVTTSIFYGAIGADIRLNSTTYIPIQLDYGVFPSSDEIAASVIGIRAGLIFDLW